MSQLQYDVTHIPKSCLKDTVLSAAAHKSSMLQYKMAPVVAQKTLCPLLSHMQAPGFASRQETKCGRDNSSTMELTVTRYMHAAGASQMQFT